MTFIEMRVAYTEIGCWHLLLDLSSSVFECLRDCKEHCEEEGAVADISDMLILLVCSIAKALVEMTTLCLDCHKQSK